jgi:small subunit ribosomal protein S27Ae
MPKDTEKKGKKVRTGRKHSKVEVGKLYEVGEKEVSRKKKFCPRCGPGVFLSEHKNRQYCGKCGYTVFEKKESN